MVECKHRPWGSPSSFVSLYFGMKDRDKREYLCEKCGSKIRFVYNKKNDALGRLLVFAGMLPMLGCWIWLYKTHIRIPFIVSIPWAISSAVYMCFVTGLVTKYCNYYEAVDE